MKTVTSAEEAFKAWRCGYDIVRKSSSIPQEPFCGIVPPLDDGSSTLLKNTTIPPWSASFDAGSGILATVRS